MNPCHIAQFSQPVSQSRPPVFPAYLHSAGSGPRIFFFFFALLFRSSSICNCMLVHTARTIEFFFSLLRVWIVNPFEGSARSVPCRLGVHGRATASYVRPWRGLGFFALSRGRVLQPNGSPQPQRPLAVPCGPCADFWWLASWACPLASPSCS